MFSFVARIIAVCLLVLVVLRCGLVCIARGLVCYVGLFVELLIASWFVQIGTLLSVVHACCVDAVCFIGCLLLPFASLASFARWSVPIDVLLCSCLFC